MRSNLIPGNTLGIIVILAVLLEGCGHKGPLMLPAPKAQTFPAQTSPAQTTSPQKTDLPPSQPIKQP